MSLSIGIVGLPNVGKSTLFNALTEKSVPAENFPFCTIDPSVGVVAVPDERLQRLTDLSESAKTIPTAIEFVDIAGLVAGASQGEGLGNKFLSNIREVDVIAEVVRIFEDPDITHVHGTVDPMNDIEVINLELVLADSETVAKRLNNIEKDVKKGDKVAAFEKELLERCVEVLEQGHMLRRLEFDDKEILVLKQLNVLTIKPILYVLNKKSDSVQLDEVRYQNLMAYLKQEKATWVEVDIGVESELAGVGKEDIEMFRQEFEVLDDGIDKLIKKGYELLNLITFFTTGTDETRAWTVGRGALAPEAGAAIHSDFADKFIRAEVISYDNLMKAGSYAKAREQGTLGTEGKDYIVKDGDVIEFKI